LEEKKEKFSAKFFLFIIFIVGALVGLLIWFSKTFTKSGTLATALPSPTAPVPAAPIPTYGQLLWPSAQALGANVTGDTEEQFLSAAASIPSAQALQILSLNTDPTQINTPATVAQAQFIQNLIIQTDLAGPTGQSNPLEKTIDQNGKYKLPQNYTIGELQAWAVVEIGAIVYTDSPAVQAQIAQEVAAESEANNPLGQIAQALFKPVASIFLGPAAAILPTPQL
jgi:hypothetical protein